MTQEAEQRVPTCPDSIGIPSGPAAPPVYGEPRTVHGASVQDEPAEGSEGPICGVKMSDAKPCGRPIHRAPIDQELVCLMHSRDPNKDKKQFLQEINAILRRTSIHHRPKNWFDFSGFVFPEANFSGEEFPQNADFSSARFTQDADFREATFIQNADFSLARFTQNADFREATFTQNADFFEATFTQNANFGGATFIQNANFRGATFEQPRLVHFFLVNRASLESGLRARFVNCRVEGVEFEDVNWYRQGGRMVLQDELDITEPLQTEPLQSPGMPPPTHELVAVVYRQLVNNFEQVRAYDLAEDCKVGAMEMKRLDPAHFLLAKWLKKPYQKWRWLRRMGEHLSVAWLYRWASNYGSSYRRAFAVLVFLLFVFAVGFALAGLEQRRAADSPRFHRGEPPVMNPWIKASEAYLAGGMHSLQVATFQRDTCYHATNFWGHLLTIGETILVPSQLALFLLALRRRFRH